MKLDTFAPRFLTQAGLELTLHCVQAYPTIDHAARLQPADLAEDLVRVRRPDERERYAAAQRQARIDPNPHQIDAVIFALRRLREGGCILADEVGLGKTIEAGLVIAQGRAEGAERVLLIVPKSLIGQWQGELLNLFGIQARENETNFFAPGVYLVGREFAGSERGATPLGTAPPFDLAVIDEAHEIFAGLHKRYGRDGIYDETSDEAQMAHRVRGFLRSTPVLLLTATPLQNSLAELWGLVQYVEPTGTLLGDITTFRKVFCDEDDRTLVPGQEHELQRRLSIVLQRTCAGKPRILRRCADGCGRRCSRGRARAGHRDCRWSPCRGRRQRRCA
jgi:hypothetical protein